jgi:hypothetical protein
MPDETIMTEATQTTEASETQAHEAGDNQAQEAAGQETTQTETAPQGEESEQAASEQGGKGDQEGDQGGQSDDQPYDLAPPEGVPEDDPSFNNFKKYAQERGWKPEVAKEAMDFYLEMVTGQYQAMDESKARAADELKEEWGADYDGNLRLAQNALRNHCSESFIGFLEQTNLGSHPEMVRAFAALGKAAGEDSLITPDGGSPAGPSRTPGGTPMFTDLAKAARGA